MRELIRRLRRHWNLTDTLVLCTNLAAFGLFIGNCWWDSLPVIYAGTLAPLAVQAARAGREDETTLRVALVFGAGAAWVWPIIEWGVTRLVGWWGAYGPMGIMLFDTPLHAVLVAWLGAAYCAYVGRRTIQMEYGPRTACGITGITAFLLGIIGENLFVAAGMWEYRESILDWWGVPAIIPVSYALAYGVIPYMFQRRLVTQVAGLLGLLVCVSVLLGLVTGFFPALDPV